MPPPPDHVPGRDRQCAAPQRPGPAVALAEPGALGLLLAVLAALGLVALSVALLVQDQGHPHAERALVLLVLVVAAGLVLGRPFASAVLAGLRRVAIVTRRLAGEWCGVPIADPYRAPGGRADPGLSRAERLRWMLGDGATWRDLLWVTVNILAGWILAAASAIAIGVGTVAFIVPALTKAVPPPAFPGNTKPVIAVLGLAIIATGVAAAPWLLRAYALLASSMLAPAGNAELALRVRQLSQTRTEALDTGAAEIRRIERDLHDGAQARLVAMGMTLDAAGQLIDTNPEAARALLIEARDASVKALATEQPDVAIVDVRLPPTFTDEGIRAALAARREVPGLPVLVLSQYVEQLYARELLASGTGGIGYLLKDRVFDSAQFVERGPAGRRRRHRDGPGGDRPLARQEHRQWQPVRAEPPRTRGARADGRGPVQRRHRAANGDHRTRRGQAHRVHLRKAGPAAVRRR